MNACWPRVNSKRWLSRPVCVNYWLFSTPWSRPVRTGTQLFPDPFFDFYHSCFEDLFDHLSQGWPCLAFIKTGELPYWEENVDHAVVVVGLDDQYIYLNDPAFPTAPVQVDRKEFELAWLEWDEKYAVVSPRP
ncbi:MAG: hypothetical protein DPW09_31430 [Anaerolineae bacterium]|nr:hypothetical protein [Anaerolineae bacterium]